MRCRGCCSATRTSRTSSPFWVSTSLSEEDKLIVGRARRIERFLSQPMFVAKAFTGQEGAVRAVRARPSSRSRLCSTVDLDHLPEQAFYMVGGAEEALAKAAQLEKSGV